MLKYFSILGLLLLVACAPDSPPGMDTGASDVREPAPVLDTALPAELPAEEDGWEVTVAGTGPVRIGSSLAELLPLLESDPSAINPDCDYVEIRDAPDGIGFMMEQERLVRIDVTEQGIETAEGAEVGDTEERIRSLYPVIEKRPHKYTDGSYLIVTPGAPGDTIRRLVFETDEGDRVTRYRAGLFPPVEYVEGCG